MPERLRGIVTVLGRILLCSIFVISALTHDIPHFGDVSRVMAAKGVPIAQASLVVAIVLLLAGSTLVVLGYRARIGAALLLLFLILATFFFHNFWSMSGAERGQQMIHFMKNVALMGAMLLIIANGAGPIGLDRATRTSD